LINLYRRRLRAQAVQELLAGAGVAVAVALVFATLVANSSIAGSASTVLHEIVGPATLQLRGWGTEGFDERLLGRVEHLPSVKQTAAVLEQNATLRAPNGSKATLLLVGGNVSLTTLDGLAHTLPASTLEAHSLALTHEAAERLGLPTSSRRAAGTTLVVDVRGQAVPLKVANVLGPEAIGAISQSLIAVMPLEELQRIALLPHRVSRILIQPLPGHEAQARAELEGLAGGRLVVARSDQDLALLHQVLRPSDQASALFAVVATLLGFLFAFNAMLITAPARRRLIADYRLGGARRSVIVQIVLFQALCLGIAASIVGGAIGYVLLRTAFHQRPGYLAEAFTLSGATVIGWVPVALTAAGGILATCLAAAVPLLDLRRNRAVDAIYFDGGEPGDWVGSRIGRRMAFGSAILLAGAGLLFALSSSLAVPAAALLGAATVLAVPAVFAAALRVSGALVARYERLTSLSIALRSLRATTLRSLALVATGAVALFGAVALGGARNELLSGLNRGAEAYTADGSLWMLNPGLIPETTTFAPEPARARAAAVPGVVGVAALRNGFTDVGGRRVLVIARPPGTGRQILRTQLIKGDRAVAYGHLAAGGWIAMSQQLANQLHVGVGGAVILPTPSGPVRLRLAAVTTNLGWPGGSIMMNLADFNRLWETRAPSTLAISLSAGASVAREQRLVRSSLGPQSGLEVITGPEWRRRFSANVQEGLNQLGEITVALLVAAILALAAALTSTIWQRRASLSGLRLSGARPARLRRVLLAEASVLLGTGCLIGVVFGLCGQFVIDAYLKQATGFPVATFAIGWYPFATLAVALVVVLGVAAIPGWSASRVSPAVALASE
jgi:putative ABC transport system permease protein